MLRKEEILSRTNNGLSVFKHYLPGNWRIGRNFLNPLYEDSKASCNIYFDRHSGMYKMKDFGDDRLRTARLPATFTLTDTAACTR